MLNIIQISINFAITGYVLANGFAWPCVSRGFYGIIKYGFVRFATLGTNRQTQNIVHEMQYYH